jgi:type II secretory pathway predicted ATPase ExeA
MVDGASKVGEGEGADPLDAVLEWVAQLTPVPHPATTIRPLRELAQGRFEVVRRVGGGGMGVVYEALDRQRDVRVALKTLYHLDAQGIYRLKNEFRALSDVVHPNLVRLYELFVDEDVWFFTMELVEGERFDRWVYAASSEEREAKLRAALGQLVTGVLRIHAAGKLHRDLKPSNVLVQADGKVVILDFGLIADVNAGGTGQTVADEHASGTPAYMAPEQAANLTSNAASDWYAVGVMVFEALAGRLPFVGSTQHVMAQKQLEEAQRLRSIVEDAPPDLDELCAALLRRDPATRPNGEQIAALTAGSRALAPRSGGPRQLLEGREGELRFLRDAFVAAASGQAVVVQVGGESGLGKTTLVTHFLDELRARPGVVVLCGRCYEREVLPYNAFDRLIDDLTRYLRHLPDAEAALLLPRNVGVLAQIFPVLARIQNVSSAPSPSGSDGVDRRRRAFVACADLLAHIRDNRALVLHIDDAQWLDLDSLLLLEHLLSLPEPIAMLLVVTHREVSGSLFPRFVKAAQANTQVVSRALTLAPLLADATRRLVRQLLEGASSAAELVDVIAAESRGSPLFAGELVRHALDRGADTAAPISFEQALSARVEKLGSQARALLDLLVVSGRPTPFEVLQAASATGGDVQRALDDLRAVQLARDAPLQHFECYHDRIRGALRARLSSEAERACHARLTEAWSLRRDADPEVLFEHSKAAGQQEIAGAHAFEAALKAGHNLAFERSANLFQKALALLSASEVARRNVREHLAHALSQSGHWHEAAVMFDEASAAAPDTFGKRQQLLHYSALHYLGSGQSNEGLPRLREVFRAVGVRWPRTRWLALFAAVLHLVWAWFHSARRLPVRLERSTAETLRLEHLLVGASLLPPHDAVRGFYFMAKFSSYALRRGSEGYATVALGMLSALFMGVPWWRARARSLADDVRMRVGAESSEPALASGALSLAAFAYFADGRAQEALALTVRAQELLADSGRAHVYSAWIARTLQAYGQLLLGNVSDAEAVFEQNARLAKESGDTMSMLGADSPLRYLIRDDASGARELVARKLALLSNIPPGGLMHHGVTVERLLCALYEGRGAETLRELKARRDAPMFFDTGMLVACCALQAKPGVDDRATRRVVMRTLRQLKRAPDGAPKQGHIAQLRAALHCRLGEVEAALLELERAENCYLRAGMILHATLMQLRAGELSGGEQGAQRARTAEQGLVELGITRPGAWARMFASGLSRP